MASHWVWSEDGLFYGRVIDYAAGGAVHSKKKFVYSTLFIFHPNLICCIFPVVGGVAALSGAWILGPRIGRFKYDEESKTWISQPIPGHNSVLAATGTFILWFGFFPFNAASGFSIVVSTKL